MLKFYHVGDVHLGASPDEGFPWSKERKEEIWESFRSLLKRADQEEVDLLLLAGDLFHRQPLKRELKELNYLFSNLTKTQIVFIAGNHDYLKPNSYYREFAWSENVRFLGGPSCQKCVFRKLHAAVYGFSYHSREITEPLYDCLQPDQDGNFSILLAHGGDEKHIPIDRRKLGASGFDYIALGHIHKPQILLADQMAYAGALEPLDRNDTGAHGFLSGTYDQGKIKLTFVPWAAREYIPLELTVDPGKTDFEMREQTARQIRRLGEKNLYKLRLTGFRDPDIVFDLGPYKALGNIVEAVDDTEPYYDLEKLKRLHGDDLIGRYIRRFEGKALSPVEKRALYLGLSAMLEDA